MADAIRWLALSAGLACIVVAGRMGSPFEPLQGVLAPRDSLLVTSVSLPEAAESAAPVIPQTRSRANPNPRSSAPIATGPVRRASAQQAPSSRVDAPAIDTGSSPEPDETNGSTLLVSASGYVTNGSVRVAVDIDAGDLNGEEPDAVLLERQLARLVDGSCEHFGDWQRTSETNVVPDGSCARYRVRVVADDGHEVVFSSPNVIRRDESAPSEPVLTVAGESPHQHVEGTTVFYNPAAGSSGAFTVSAASADPESGLATIELPQVFGTDGADGSRSPLEAAYSWSEGATASGNRPVVVTNGAGESASANLTVTPDTAPPHSGSVGYPDGIVTDGSVTITTDPGTDSLSGVDPATGKLERRTGALNGDACQFGEEWTAASSPDALPAAPACVQYRFRVADRVGNEAVYMSPNAVKVPDTTSPTARVTTPGAGSILRGGVEIYAEVEDSGTGVGTVSFEYSPAGTDTWTGIGSDSEAPFGVTWDTATVADGAYDVRAVVTDRAGNGSTSAAITVSIDNTVPEALLSDPGSSLTGTATLAAEATDLGSGVASVEFQVAPAAGGWTTFASDADGPYGASLDTISLADGTYSLRVVVTDGAGNQGVSQEVTVQVENVTEEVPPEDEDDDSGEDGEDDDDDSGEDEEDDDDSEPDDSPEAPEGDETPPPPAEAPAEGAPPAEEAPAEQSPPPAQAPEDSSTHAEPAESE